MAKQNISIGTAANDGTGDTLRIAGQKINNNFNEIYPHFGTSGLLSAFVNFTDSGIDLVDSSFTNRIKTVNLTNHRRTFFPDDSGNVVLDVSTQTLTNKTLTTPVISQISNSGTLTLPTSTDTLVGRATSDTLSNKTLSNPILNLARIGTHIADSTGNEFIKFTKAGSAVNELTIAQGASSTGPTLSATGGGTNINLFLTSKGTGSVEISKAAFSDSEITSNGTVSTSATFIIGNKSSQLNVDLSEGTTIGEYKIFVNKGAGDMVVTPTHSSTGNNIFAQGVRFTLAENDGCTCVWEGNEWFLVGNQGEVTVS